MLTISSQKVRCRAGAGKMKAMQVARTGRGGIIEMDFGATLRDCSNGCIKNNNISIAEALGSRLEGHSSSCQECDRSSKFRMKSI